MNLLRTLFTVGSMTFISRILGFVRDTLIARVFGAGILTDTFFVAFRVPNFLRRISAEGAFSQAFVPILSEYKQQRSHNEVKALINHVATLLGLFLLLLTIIGMLAAPWIVQFIAYDAAAEAAKFTLTVELLRIMFPYILFISLVALAGGVLNTYGNFTTPAFTPVWLNVSFIIAMLFIAPYFDHAIQVLAWAVFVGGILQLIFQLPYLSKLGLIPKFSIDFSDTGIKRILKLMGPAIIGVSAPQISILINTMIAASLTTGSVSWLYFADRLMEFPTGLLGVALGTILLPHLSKSVAEDNHDEYAQLLDWGLRLTFMLALPAAVALAVLAVPLVTSLFKYGAFTSHDVMMTKMALIAYSLGLMGLILIKVLAPGFYARQNIKTPVKIALFTLFVTQLMNVLFVFVLDFKEYKHAGLALAIGLGACVNAALLFFALRKEGRYQPRPGWFLFMLRLLIAVVAMAVCIGFAAGPEVLWLEYSLIQKFTRLSLLVLLGGGVYFVALWLMGIRVKDFIHRSVV